MNKSILFIDNSMFKSVLDLNIELQESESFDINCFVKLLLIKVYLKIICHNLFDF